ncbi:MAG: serine hydrolase domain-containing protein [Sphingorhabdus sp.]
MEQQLDMQLSRRSIFAMAGLGALAAAIPAPLYAFASREYPEMTANMMRYLETRKAAGIVMAVGIGDDAPDIIKSGTLSFASQTPVDEHSLFRVYSMTKPITGIAAMILVDDGKIKLDQPIADFLPEFAKMRVLTDSENSMESVPAKTQITLRHLLTHTAGLGYSIISKGPLLKAYMANGITPGVVSKLPIPGFTGGAPTPDIETFSKRLGALPLIAEPGTKWSYSVALDLLGHLIGVVSGMKFEEFLAQRIFGPLGMKSSFFHVPKSEVHRFTTNYAVNNGKLLPIDPGQHSIFLDKPAFAFGGAGLVSTAHDYDHFLHCMMNFGKLGDVRIMSDAAARLALSNLLPAAVNTDGTFVNGATFGAGGRVGLGIQAGSFGWGGAAGTNAFVSTKYRVRATGMIQYMPSRAQDFQSKFPGWVIADLVALGVIG